MNDIKNNKPSIILGTCHNMSPIKDKKSPGPGSYDWNIKSTSGNFKFGLEKKLSNRSFTSSNQPFYHPSTHLIFKDVPKVK